LEASDWPLFQGIATGIAKTWEAEPRSLRKSDK
jgi:hypothetical protein